MLGNWIFLLNDCKELTFLVLSRIVSTFQIKTISKLIMIFLQYFGLLAFPVSSRMVIIQRSNLPSKYIPKVLDVIEGILKTILTIEIHCCIAWTILRVICGYCVRLRNSNEVYFLPSCLMCTNIPYRIILLLSSPSTLDKCFHDPYVHVYVTYLKYIRMSKQKLCAIRPGNIISKLLSTFFYPIILDLTWHERHSM